MKRVSLVVGLLYCLLAGGCTEKESVVQQAATPVPQPTSKLTIARDRTRDAARAVVALQRDLGRLPRPAEGLSLLYEPPAGATAESKWQGPYLKQDQLTDPWGAPLELVFPDNYAPPAVDVRSLGPDGMPSDDDIYGLQFESWKRVNVAGLGLFLVFQHMQRMPTEEEGLTLLYNSPDQADEAKLWRGKYVDRQFLVDAWGRPLEYVATDRSPVGYDVRSLGPDGVVSADDIYSMQTEPLRQAFSMAEQTHVAGMPAAGN